MGKIRFRLSDEDRERYGGPEWVDFDLDRVTELPVAVVEEFEDATGYTILGTMPDALHQTGQKAMRAAAWLARAVAGINEPPFAGFEANMRTARWEFVEDDADPPAPANRAQRRARKTTTSTSTKRTRTTRSPSAD